MLVSVYDICCIVEREDKQVIRLTKENGRKCFTGTATETKNSKYSDYRVSSIVGRNRASRFTKNYKFYCCGKCGGSFEQI